MTSLTNTHRFGSDEGITLLEVVMAIVILLLVLVPISYVLTNSISQSANARQRTTALGLAEQEIETLNVSGPPLVNGVPGVGTWSSPITDGSLQGITNGTYHVSYAFYWASINGVDNLCTSPTVPQALDVSVKVTWGAYTYTTSPSNFTSDPSETVTDATLLDYPPSSVPTNGFLTVQIEGDPSGTGNPEPADVFGVAWGGAEGRVLNVPVTATLAGTTYTGYPDGNGCVVMEVPPTSGTPYNVQVGPETLNAAFVASGGTATSITTTAAVSTDTVTSLGPYLYDEGAFINVALPNTTSTENGVTCVNSGSVQCIVTGQAPNSATAPNTAPDATVSVLSGTTWTSSTLPSGVSQIESVACSSACVGVGFGPNGASYQGEGIVDSTSSPGAWSVSTPPAAWGVTNLTQVVCPSATTCLAIGSGASSAVLLAATVSSGSLTWTANDTLPSGVTSLSQIVCSGTVCLAIGTGATATTPVVIAGTVSSATQTFVSDGMPMGAGVTSLSQIVCSGTTACLAIGTGSTATTPVLIAGTVSSATQTFVSDTLPMGAGVTSLSQIVCSGTTACLAIGTGATATTPVLIAGTVSSATQTFVSDGMPMGAGVTSLSQIVCSGTTACLAIGGTSSGGAIISGSVSPVAQTFANDTLPPGVTSVSQIVCSGTTACVVIGNTSSGAAIVAGSVSAAAQTFANDTLPSGVAYLSGVDCFVTGSTTTCEAPGASQTGAVLLSDATVSSGSQTWTSSLPSNLGGMTLANLPVSVNGTELSSAFTVCASGACGASVGPLFPFASGYSIGAGDCAAEVATASAQAATQPAASGSSATSVVLPLGLLPIEVTSANGNPLAGATVTAKVADPNLPADQACNDNVTYTLPTTGPDGVSNVAAMYETYTITVQQGSNTATVTVELTPTGTTATYSSGPAVSAALPQPVVVAL